MGPDSAIRLVIENEALEPSLLRTFSPLDGFKKENLAALARKTSLKDLSAGRTLFREGDNDKRTYYLVRGEIDGPRVCYCLEPRALRRLKSLVGSL